MTPQDILAMSRQFSSGQQPTGGGQPAMSNWSDKAPSRGSGWPLQSSQFFSNGPGFSGLAGTQGGPTSTWSSGNPMGMLSRELGFFNNHPNMSSMLQGQALGGWGGGWGGGQAGGYDAGGALNAPGSGRGIAAPGVTFGNALMNALSPASAFLGALMGYNTGSPLMSALSDFAGRLGGGDSGGGLDRGDAGGSPTGRSGNDPTGSGPGEGGTY